VLKIYRALADQPLPRRGRIAAVTRIDAVPLDAAAPLTARLAN